MKTHLSFSRKVLMLLFAVLLLFSSNSQAQVVINEVMFDVPSNIAGDANGDGIRSPRGDEFIELVNIGASSTDISGWKILQKDLGVVFTFPANVVLKSGEFCVIFGGVDPAGFGSQFPSELQIFASQSGADKGFAGGSRTNFSNAGDNVIIRNSSDSDIAEVCWGSASIQTSVGIKLESPNTLDGSSISGSIRQSVTREPDRTGLWATHSTVGNNLNFTPGALNTGEFVDPAPSVQYTLVVNTSGNGSVVLDPIGGVYDSSSVVTVTAVPAGGWEFQSWSGDLSGSTNPTTITMTSNKSITATFVVLPNQAPIVEANGPYVGTINNAVAFSSAGSNDPDGSIASYAWTFGDGSTSTQANPSYAYTATGTYNVTLTVTDTEGLTGTDNASVSITDAPPDYALLPYTTGFESGALDINWFTQSSDPLGQIVVGTTQNPRTGSYQLLMDVSTSGTYVTNEAWIKLNLAGLTEVNFVVWWKESGDENHDEDGIFISDDAGATFVKIYNLTGGSSTHQEVALELGALAVANGMSLTNQFVVKLQQHDNYPFTSDGFGFDDISITSPIQHSLTVNTVGQGNVTLDPDGGTYGAGAQVTLTAIPAQGYGFDNWSGGLTGSQNPATITMDADKNVTATFSELPPDYDSPTPNPMTWATVPYATSNTSIAMIATTASDASGVEYNFTETSGNPGGDNSGWQDSPSYTDTGLSPETQYTYNVQVRDKSLNQNTTAVSSSESATTPDVPAGINEDGPVMRLAGNHTFTATASGAGGIISWTVDRLTMNEGGGSQSRSTGVYTATGPSATFNLSKTSGKETVYEIFASDNGFNEMIAIQVFPPNVRSSFMYSSAGNPDVEVYVVVPSSLSSATHLASIHHGSSRNGDDYIMYWDPWGQQNDYLLIAPEFSDSDWPGSRSYNLGNMFTGNDGSGSLNPESLWAYSIARDVAIKALNEFGLNDTQYDAYGHSAGGQFVHRMLIFRPDAPIRLAFPANPGWWTAPDLSIEYPYGLGHSLLSYTQQDITDWTLFPMIILRGEDDHGTSGLRTTPEAMAQGDDRYERAMYMYNKGLEANPNCIWEIYTEPNVGHSGELMSIPAQAYLEANPPAVSILARQKAAIKPIEFTIHPNPSKGKFYVTIKENVETGSYINILGMDGSIVKRVKAEQGHNDININYPGLYIITYKGNHARVVITK